MSMRFEYGTTRIKDLQVVTARDPRGKLGASAVLLQDEPMQPSNRFWTSLHLRFGFTSNIFRYFSHAEVFERISATVPNDRVRYCVERDDKGKGRLLAVSGPEAALMPHDELQGLLARYGATD